MKLQIEALCDIGCVRSSNQDMILIGNQLVRDQQFSLNLEFEDSQHKFLVAVADGMGGHAGGEFASQFVLEQLRWRINEMRLDIEPADLPAILNRWFQETHRLLVYHGFTHPEVQGLGTTFVGLFFYAGKVYLLNIGDSRCYRYRQDFLVQLSQDHSLQEAMRDNEVPSNVITNALGGSSTLYLDLEEISSRVFTDDTFLLCSDGLSGELNDEKIEILLVSPDSVGALVKAAKEAGGKDNISCLRVTLQ